MPTPSRRQVPVVTANKRQAWNYTPDLPLRSAPFLHWPLRPAAIGQHLVKSWQPLTARVAKLAAAFVLWEWSRPSLAEAESFRLDWILEIWIRNIVLLAVVAGGLHLFLQRFRAQGDDLRYDARPMTKNKSLFLFNDQVKENMFLSMVPGMVVATAVESLGWWSYANGIVRHWSFSDNPVWFVVLMGLIPLWATLYFSAQHWLLHRRWTYAHIHSWHHRNMNVGPWSGLSMHPLEQMLLFSDLVVLLLIVPSSPAHMLFALMHHTMGAPMSHTGYDAVRLPLSQRFELGNFHHQLHHRFIECNYGDIDSPLDELIGAFHDGTPEGDEMVTERLRQISDSRQL